LGKLAENQGKNEDFKGSYYTQRKKKEVKATIALGTSE